MKIGDRMAVQIEGVDVAEAIVEDIDNGNVTLVIPATRLVVKMRQSLDLTATATPEVDRVFAGVVDDTGPANSAAADEANNNAPEPTAAPVVAPGLSSAEVGEGIHGLARFPGEMD